jgi:hypothetical protein
MIENEIGLVWQIIIAALVGSVVLLRFCDVVKKIMELKQLNNEQKHLRKGFEREDKVEQTNVDLYCVLVNDYLTNRKAK